jgi:hypothetical protein
MPHTRAQAEQARRSIAFAQGVCAALAVVAHSGDEVLWMEIVRANGGYDYLHGISKRGGNLRADGFTRYRPEPRS